MLTIDEIKIEGDEDGFHLILHTDAAIGGPQRFLIGMPDQFLRETERVIGNWIEEGQRAARQHQIDQGTAPSSRNVELDEAWGPTEGGGSPYEADHDLARDIERGK
jgi:hypothetical protein